MPYKLLYLLLSPNSWWLDTTPQESYCSLGMHFLLLEKSKNVAHIKM